MSKFLKSIILLVSIPVFFLSCDLFQANTYQLTYDANGAESGAVPIDANEYEAGEPVTVLGNVGNLEKYGHTFGGWNTEADGSGTTYTEGKSLFMGQTNLRLYAYWIEDTTFYVTYDGNDADSGEPPVDDTEYLAGETVTVSDNTCELVKDGFCFRGWNTEADFSGTHYLAEESFPMPASDVTLFAVWDVPSSLTYDSNQATSGTSPKDGNEYLVREEVTVLGNTGNLVRTGYTFIGWNTKDDGSGIGYSGGQTFDMPSSDTTLFAEWEIKTYDVTFNSDGGSEVAPQERDHGATIDEPDIPTKQHYSFGGWFKEPELENPWNFDTDTVAEDITLYAKWDSIYPETFAGGSGTEADPYQVETAGHLYIVRNHLDKHFIQTADIDLSAFSEGDGWEPIGAYYGVGFADNELFIGSFNGDTYTISNLVINREGSDGVGLFGYVSGNANFTDVKLENIDILGNRDVGGLIGRNESSGVISYCSVSGTIDGNSTIGGLIGRNASNIKYCHSTSEILGGGWTGGLVGTNTGDVIASYATGTVEAKMFLSENTGGLIGWNSGDITKSYATGNVNGSSYTSGMTGGLIGTNSGFVTKSFAIGNVKSGREAWWTGGLIGYNNGQISECFATGEVDSQSSSTGGLIGANRAEITNCYARGNVKGTTSVGGLIGSSTGSILHSYSVGAVSGTTGVGGMIGASTDGSVDYSYYDKETSTLSVSAGGTPKTTEEMMQQTTFVDWDFTDIWAIDGGTSYPYLQWENE